MTLLQKLQNAISTEGVFNISSVSSGLASALKEALMLTDPMSFTDITKSDFVQSGQTVTFSATTNFEVLNVNGIKIDMVFSEDTSDDIKVIAKLSLPSDWKLSQSFPDLTELFPFNQFDIGTGAVGFVYSSHTNPIDNQKVDEAKDISITVNKGLNFYLSDLSGLVSMPGISTLTSLLSLESLSSTLKTMLLTGTFLPNSSAPYPVINLTAGFDQASFSINTPFSTSVEKFTLLSPQLKFEITEPKQLIQDFILSVDAKLEVASGDDLSISVLLDESADQITLKANPVAGKEFTVTDLESLIPGASVLQNFQSAELTSIFSTIALNSFNLSMGLSGTNTLKSIDLSLAGQVPDPNHAGQFIPATYTIIDDYLTVENVTFSYSKVNTGDNSVEKANLTAQSHLLPKTIFPGYFNFKLDLENDGSKWDLNDITARYHGLVKVSDIITSIDSAALSYIPEVFQSLEFTDFYIEVDKANNQWSCGTGVDFNLVLDDINFYSSTALKFTRTKPAKQTDPPVTTWSIDGELLIGSDYTLSYTIDNTGDGKSITVTGVDTGTPLGFNTLLQTLGFQEEIPANLDIDITQASFTYDFTTKEFDFTITSATYGTSSLVKNSDGIVVYFKPNFTLGSGQIPLVGPELKGLLKFDDIGLLVSTAKVSDLSNYSSLGLPSDITSLDKGIYLTATIKALGGSQSVQGLIYSFDSTRSIGRPSMPNLPTAGTGSGSSNGSSDTGTGSQTPAATGANSGGSGSAHVFTIPIKKQLGPVYLDSLGFSYENDVLNIIFNASLTLGTISMDFDDLEIGSPLSHFDPHGSLKGLSMGYHTDDVSIEGAFVHEGQEYDGMFVLSLTKFQLAAIGAYEEHNGSPSIFLYGVLDEPLGGPAFMFVEGLAVAFGYNRAFIAPPVTDVSTFPLITAATSGPPSSSSANLATMLGNLNEYIPPKHGEYFIGLGIKFMSFKVINSFALLIGEFGKELEFDLLGVSTYVAPNPKDPKPTAIVELEIVGTYNVAKGSLIVRGQLTQDSFVLSKKCHLQGGFAIAFWTKGTHDGEFVFCFGGYGNHYTPKSYYPQGVPQLQFLWQVNSQVSIKGGGYWALTPKAIMAGGFLKATYQNGWVKACFDANAYFLIHWAPLYYQAGFTVSFSLSVKVDLLFCSVWLGFEISEQLRLHGPEFGGAAGISLYVATIWIHFGAKKGAVPLLSWSDFANKHLPKKDDSATQDKDHVLSVDIVSGLIKRVSNNQGGYTYIVNPKELHITTGSFVPSTTFNLPSGTKDGTDFTIKPMGDPFQGAVTPNVAATSNASTHTVTFTGTDVDTSLSCTLAEPKNAPSSMWYATQPDSKVPESNTTALHFGTDVQPITPPKSDRTTSVPRKELVDSKVSGPGYFLSDLNKFNGQPTTGASCAGSMTNGGDLSTNTVSQLDSVFSLSGNDPTDFSGLKTRLQKMANTSISKGTLYKAS